MRKIRAHSERRFFHYKNLELSEHTKADGKEHIFEYRPLLNYSNGSDGTAPESNDARPFVRGSIDADVRNPILIFNVFQVLQSPLSGEKKCEHFSSPEFGKKYVNASIPKDQVNGNCPALEQLSIQLLRTGQVALLPQT